MRSGEFYGKFSVAEVLGSCYGMGSRLFVAFPSIIFCALQLAAQLRALGNLLAIVIGVSPEFIVIITAVLVISYSFFGVCKPLSGLIYFNF